MATDITIVGAGGEYMESVSVVEWKVAPGDKVAPGQVVVIVETAKAATEVEARATGVLSEILADVGAEVGIGSVLGRIDDGTPGNREPAPTTSGEPTSAPIPVETRGSTGAALRSGRARDRVFASPLARRVARDLGVDLTRVAGTGPGGRIKRRDVEGTRQALDKASTGTAAPQRVVASDPDDDVLVLYEPDSYELVPHDRMRIAIAERMSLAKRTVPHFYVSTECRLDALLTLRSRASPQAPQHGGAVSRSISVNDLLVTAFARALAAVPEANVTWAKAGLMRHHRVDLAVAVAVQGGLITPIIRGADTKSVSAISAEMEKLAVRARERLLSPQEYLGGTSSISNLGMFGIDEFSAIINPPQASILAVGAGRRVGVVEDGELVAATTMKATLSVDHRALDGVVAARLLTAFRNFVEHPAVMILNEP